MTAEGSFEKKTAPGLWLKVLTHHWVGNRDKKAANAASGEKKRNLTEEEKRSNHIESEQKRRDQISESFNAMVRLVPERRHSKSEKLRLACTWLESIVADNEENGAILASTEPMVGEFQFL
ncbi:hypothetical protein MMC31_006708 [Peltigera leucophlebia]|nr:hypothetical protein [Peltigera leucophlebia]